MKQINTMSRYMSDIPYTTMRDNTPMPQLINYMQLNFVQFGKQVHSKEYFAILGAFSDANDDMIDIMQALKYDIDDVSPHNQLSIKRLRF